MLTELVAAAIACPPTAGGGFAVSDVELVNGDESQLKLEILPFSSLCRRHSAGVERETVAVTRSAATPESPERPNL